MAAQALGVRLSGFFARGGNPPAGERCAAFPLRDYSAARGFSLRGYSAARGLFMQCLLRGADTRLWQALI